MKRLFILIAIVLTNISCTKDSIEGASTHTIHIYPDDMSKIYVQHGESKFKEEANGENYEIEFLWIDSGPGFRLSAKSLEHTFQYAGLSADGNDIALDVKWKIENESFSARGETDENNFYSLTLIE